MNGGANPAAAFLGGSSPALPAESDPHFQLVARRARGILVKRHPIPACIADLRSHLDIEFVDEPECCTSGGAGSAITFIGKSDDTTRTNGTGAGAENPPAGNQRRAGQPPGRREPPWTGVGQRGAAPRLRSAGLLRAVDGGEAPRRRSDRLAGIPTRAAPVLGLPRGQGPMRYVDDWILAAMQAVIDSADDTGCSEDLTVTSKAALDRLSVVLGHARKNNEQARDLKRLVKLALETQDAANPRPLSTLLTNLIHTVMAGLGNPGYENSAAIRLVLHQLLPLLDRSSLPKYDREMTAYMADIDACEGCIGVKAAA